MGKSFAFLLVLLVASEGSAAVNQTKAQPTETPRFFHKGLLMADCTIPGEGKKDNVQPSNAICWQLSRNRYIWVYVTTSFQGPDSVRAIVYQIRKDTPDGQVLRESVLSPSTETWDPFDRGERYFKQQGHNKVFGVPKGALDKNGRLLPNHNVFCATWYQVPRIIDPRTKVLLNTTDERTRKLELVTRLGCVQFRLNAAEDDIEALTPLVSLRQNGFATGEAFCELGTRVSGVNQWYTPYMPYDDDCGQWVDVRHFYGPEVPGIAPVMMQFNPKTGLYEWVKTGPLTMLEKRGLIECSLCRVGGEWIVAARPNVWFKTNDLFAGLGKATVRSGPPQANQSAYVCGDGVLRVFGGSADLSPFQWVRNPQYCWDVDPNTFALSNCKTVLSTDDIGMVASRSVKFRTFLSPPFQNRQIVTMTVSKEVVGKPDELELFGVHYWYVTYAREIQNEWRFAE